MVQTQDMRVGPDPWFKTHRPDMYMSMLETAETGKVSKMTLRERYSSRFAHG